MAPSTPMTSGVAAESTMDDDLSALLAWMWSFPQLSNVSRYGCNAIDCLAQREVVAGILQSAKEILDVEANRGGCPSTGCDETWSQIVELIGMDAERSVVDVTKKTVILSTLLRHAVSTHCDMRSTYIGRITGLDPDVQRNLMRIIEEGDPDRVESDNVGGSSGSECELNESHSSDAQSSGSRGCQFKQNPSRELLAANPSDEDQSSLKLNEEADLISPSKSHDIERMEQEMEGLREIQIATSRDMAAQEELRERNLELSLELEASRQRESELGSKIEELESRHRADRMKIESNAISQEQSLRDQHAEEMAILRKEVEQLRDSKQRACDAEDELSALRDEIDVFRHSAEKLAATEEQLRKCKHRLEQMGDVKELLTREEEAHSAAVAKNLDLDNELNKLKPLRRQLEEYKTRAVDAEVQLVECQERLQKLEYDTEELSGVNRELQAGAVMHQTETDEMRKRMMNESDDKHDGNAIGEGISELNPALKEEMLRLRNENARLREFAAKRENDSVQKLEESIDDQERLAKKFKEKYLSTKSELEGARHALHQSQVREEQLKAHVAELVQAIDALESQLKKERMTHQKALRDLDRSYQASKRSIIDKAREDLSRQEKENNDLLEEGKRLAKEKLAKAADELKEAEESSKKALADLREKSSTALRTTREKYQDRIDKMEKEHGMKIGQMEKTATEERKKLVSMGKKMIQNSKNENQNLIKDAEDAHETKINEFRQTLSNFQRQQKEYEQKAMAKISAYKHKLHVSNGKHNELMRSYEELQRQHTKLDRELKNLQVDNDRLRRQVGSRFGGDSDQRFESLQREFNDLLDENRVLKSTHVSPFSPDMHTSILEDDSMNSSYANSGGNVSNTTLAQLRTEYEDTIQTLTDEKRELVMRNSAAITDVQKAEQRSWELEEELTRVKNQLTRATLSLQRAEMLNEETVGFEVPQGTKVSILSSPDGKKAMVRMEKPKASGGNCVVDTIQNIEAPSWDEAPKHIVETDNSFTGEDGKENQASLVTAPKPKHLTDVLVPKSPHNTKKSTTKVPSLMEYTKLHGKSKTEGGRQECQQS